MLRKTAPSRCCCAWCAARSWLAGLCPKAEAAKCADCGMAVPKDQAADAVGGKPYCGHCAAAQSASLPASSTPAPPAA